MSDAAVAERFKLAMPGDSFQERARALAAIKNDSYRLTERAVQAFLGFLFVALVLLKLFEPRSVKVYFSERLQGLYRQYRGGLFDSAPRARRAIGRQRVDERAEVRGLVPQHLSRRSRARRQRHPRRRAHAVLRELGIRAWRDLLDPRRWLRKKRPCCRRSQRSNRNCNRRRWKSLGDPAQAGGRGRSTGGVPDPARDARGALKRPGSPSTLTAVLSSLSEVEAAAAKAFAQKSSSQERLDTLAPLVADLQARRAELSARLDKVAKTRKQGESELAEVRMRHMAELQQALAARWTAAAKDEARYEGPPEEPKHVM